MTKQRRGRGGDVIPPRCPENEPDPALLPALPGPFPFLFLFPLSRVPSPFLTVPVEYITYNIADGTKIHRWETADAGLTTLKDIPHSVSMLTRFRACRPERALARRGDKREKEREKGREGSGRTAERIDGSSAAPLYRLERSHVLEDNSTAAL